MVTRAARNHRARRCRRADPAVGTLVPAEAPADYGQPRSLGPAVGDYVRAMPAESRVILEMLAVLNQRTPLAQLGQAAEVTSPSAAIEPAAAAGLVDWWPAEPSCPVAIRHPLVRDADLRRHPGQQAPAAARSRRRPGQRGDVLGTPGGRPGPARRGPGRRAGAARRRRSGPRPPRAGRHPPAVGLGHLPGPGRPRTAAADRRTAPDPRRRIPRPGPARGRRGHRLVPAAQLRAGHDGVLLRPARRGRAAVQPGAGAGPEQDPDSQPLAAEIASRLADTSRRLGDGQKAQAYGRQALGTGCPGPGGRQPDAHPDRHRHRPGGRAARRPGRATAPRCRSGPGLPRRRGRPDLPRSVPAAGRGPGPGRQRSGRQPQAGAAGRHGRPGPARPLLSRAGPVPGRGVGRRGGHRRAGVLGGRDPRPPPRAAAAAPGRGCVPGRRAARPRRPNGTPGWPRRQRPAWTTARNGCTRRWPGPWPARPRTTTWAWPTRSVPGRTTRRWTAAAGSPRCCGGRCWPRA